MSFSIFKDKLNGLLKKIQSNPILDAGAKAVLNDVPLVGTFLLNLYENSADSTEEKSKLIRRILLNLEKMNEKTIDDLSAKLKENKDKILENNNSLKIIQEDTSRIALTLENLTADEQQRFEDTKIEFKELHLRVTNIAGQIIDKIDEASTQLNKQIEDKIDDAILKFQSAFQATSSEPVDSASDKLLMQNGFSQARELVTVLLEDPRFPKHKRTFNTIRTTVTVFSDNELRRILIYSGGIRFGSDTNELWGLATKTIELSKFTQQELGEISADIKNNPKRVPEQSMKIILKDPKFPQGIRSLIQIKKYFTGFSEDQIKMILLLIRARGLRGEKYKL